MTAGLSLTGLVACGGTSPGGSVAGSSGSSTPHATATASSTRQSPSPGTSSPAGAKTATTTITIKNFTYHPKTVTVKPGTTIKVVNQDKQVRHTLTSDAKGAFNTHAIAGGATKTFTAPRKPKRYPYHCNYRSFMHGTLVVAG
jgi:plastocyanin